MDTDDSATTAPASTAAVTVATDAQFAAAWRSNRAHLLNVAYGVLGDIGAAEDAVQEAFTRFAQAEYGSILDHRGWLIVVTSRICLDQISSARSRRERTRDPDTVDYIRQVAPTRSLDPADRVTLDDEVRAALLTVLERLSPAERVVFVLHDIFQTPFDSIAETVGRPSATCRQLARRARARFGRSGKGHTVASIRASTARSLPRSSRRVRSATSMHSSACSHRTCGAMSISDRSMLEPGSPTAAAEWSRATCCATSVRTPRWSATRSAPARRSSPSTPGAGSA